ncbi:carbon-nitrogen hydrolase family protein [Candidatus Poribacteria bacterium]|nr:carbon-nitrogen hydrolase family protein [Candidatus Poribacteria bacterium]
MFVKFSILSTVAAFFVNYSIFATTENASPPSPPVNRGEAGKKVTVAAICIGTGGDHDEKVKQAIDYLNTAGQNKADIACLPEEFAGFNAEPIPGPTTNAIAKLACQYNMYVICPIREQAGDKQYNTAVLINRKGEVVGSYRKVFVYWGEGLTPSKGGVKIFDTDFGKISILTCFDLNFAELWYEADALDAEIVFWPSAYGGGMPLNAYAMLYHYYIVPVGWGNIIDITGENMKDVIKPKDGMFIATLDLDRTLIHTNFNTEKVAKLLEEPKDEVVQEHYYDMESWYLLKSVKPGVSVRELCKKYEIETLRQYQHRSRRQINEVRETGGII